MHNHRSKRIYNLKVLWPRLFVVAGVFLLGAVFAPQPASARSGLLDLEAKDEPPSLIEENERKIKELDNHFKTEQEKIAEKLQAIDDTKKEADALDKTKQDLAREVTTMKEEIKILRAKVAEKKRLEAERIVPPSNSAPDAAGNLYALGNCTYYVKMKRPDLSNSLGNANTWYSRAASLGYKVGSMAKQGAVGTTTVGYLGHVVYVERYLGNGKILISEMNALGLGVISSRTADESEFMYIYEL